MPITRRHQLRGQPREGCQQTSTSLSPRKHEQLPDIPSLCTSLPLTLPCQHSSQHHRRVSLLHSPSIFPLIASAKFLVNFFCVSLSFSHALPAS